MKKGKSRSDSGGRIILDASDILENEQKISQKGVDLELQKF